jgi:hypothetical protein
MISSRDIRTRRSHDASGTFMQASPSQTPKALCETTYVGEDDTKYFRRTHGRTLNTMNERYMLPVDEDEVQVHSISSYAA